MRTRPGGRARATSRPASTSPANASASALRPGAVLVFTVEALADDDPAPYTILPNGRYAHGRTYLDRTIADAGLSTLRARRDVLRNEAGAPVNGWLMAVARPA